MSANTIPRANRRFKRLNGWQVRNGQAFAKFEKVPAMPTRWERFCCANKIEDPLFALKNGKRKLILDWVHKYHDNSYCPESVLQELGVETRWVS